MPKIIHRDREKEIVDKALRYRGKLMICRKMMFIQALYLEVGTRMPHKELENGSIQDEKMLVTVGNSVCSSLLLTTSCLPPCEENR